MARVLIVTDALWNGGAERQLALLASSLPEPWSASVLSMEDGPYRPVLEKLGVEVRLTPRRSRYDVTAAARMWRAAADIGPDIVHSWGWMSTLAMVPFCRARGVPLVNNTIQVGCLPSGRLGGFRLAMSLSDAIVANSRAGLAAFGLPENARNHVVYNGFDATRLESIATGAAAPFPNEETVAIMAARMYPEKDWHLLLDAARVLAAEDCGWRFIALGDGPSREGLMREAEDLIRAGVVAFPPSVLEAMPSMAEADVGVLFTDPASNAAEGISNAIMEYMACGLPVVCTGYGGNPELVEGGVTGLLVAPKDVDAVVSALRALRSDPARAHEMGVEGRRRLDRRFAVDTMSAAFVHLYVSLLADRKGARR